MEFRASLVVEDADTPLLLEKRIELLRAIDKAGSISKAAKMVPMSYKAAWDAIDTINNLCAKKVVSKETGGVGGGGAKITPYGKNLIESYDILKEEHQRFLKRVSKITDFDSGTLKSLKRVAMQISSRNQIQGIVKSIKEGGVNCEVDVELKSGCMLRSIVTKSAIHELELQVNDEVVAIFKASSVLLSTQDSISISAQNILKGSVSAIVEGDVNSEVSVDIGEDILSCITASSSLKPLDLSVGKRVVALIKASDIMLGK